MIPFLFFLAFFVDMLSVGLVIPLLPQFITFFSVPKMYIGVIQSMYGFCQIVSTPFLGALSDRVGRRRVMLISVFGTASSFGIIALSLQFNNFSLFMLSRAVIGLSRQGITMANAFVSDVTQGKDDVRTVLMGRVSSAAYLGFVFGPAVGGYLVEYVGILWCVALASLINFLNLGLMYNAMPSTVAAGVSNSKKEQTSQQQGSVVSRIKASILSPFSLALDLGRNRLIAVLFASTASCSAAGILNFSTATMMIRDRFGFTAYETGIFQSSISLVNFFNLSFMLPSVLLPKLNQDYLMKTAAIGTVIGYSLQVTATTSQQYLCGCMVVACTACVVDTISKSLFSKAIPPNRVGEAIGIINSIDGVNRVLCPILGSALMEVSMVGPAVVSVMLSCVSAVLCVTLLSSSTFRNKHVVKKID
eukprot:PhF_6_TR21144/c0_g1_i1/m.30417